MHMEEVYVVVCLVLGIDACPSGVEAVCGL